jgi:hypothetical protein
MTLRNNPLLSRDDAFRLSAQPAIDHAADDAADQRCYPEQPELLQSPAADEQCGTVLRAGFTDVLVTGMLTR